MKALKAIFEVLYLLIRTFTGDSRLYDEAKDIKPEPPQEPYVRRHSYIYVDEPDGTTVKHCKFCRKRASDITSEVCP